MTALEQTLIRNAIGFPDAGAPLSTTPRSLAVELQSYDTHASLPAAELLARRVENMDDGTICLVVRPATIPRLGLCSAHS